VCEGLALHFSSSCFTLKVQEEAQIICIFIPQFNFEFHILVENGSGKKMVIMKLGACCTDCLLQCHPSKEK
jgi:hypothetical protein